jgi:hypothetical protein
VSQRRKRSKLIHPDELAPGIAAGLTQGVPLSELKRVDSEERAAGRRVPSGLSSAQHLNEKQPGRHVIPHFVGRDNPESPLVRVMPDGRRFADVNLTFPTDVLRAIQAGMICMKCLEPQETSFGDRHIVNCEGVLTRGPHYMRDWQIIEFALEFSGDTHIGPSRPINEHLEDLDEKTLRREFDQRIAAGKSPMRGLR